MVGADLNAVALAEAQPGGVARVEIDTGLVAARVRLEPAEHRVGVPRLAAHDEAKLVSFIVRRISPSSSRELAYQQIRRDVPTAIFEVVPFNPAHRHVFGDDPVGLAAQLLHGQACPHDGIEQSVVLGDPIVTAEDVVTEPEPELVKPPPRRPPARVRRQHSRRVLAVHNGSGGRVHVGPLELGPAR